RDDVRLSWPRGAWNGDARARPHGPGDGGHAALCLAPHPLLRAGLLPPAARATALARVSPLAADSARRGAEPPRATAVLRLDRAGDGHLPHRGGQARE